MLSFVIPILNEAGNLDELHRQISHVADQNHYDIEFIFVDDGSKDESWRVVSQIAKHDERVQGIKFRRNFGKAEALSAGFDAAVGEVVFMMDGDLQDDPAEIPRFLAKLNEGFDVVNGWKRVRHDPWHKVIPSRMFNWLVRLLTGVNLHDHNCGFKCCRREVYDEVRLYGEMHRFIPVLADARGFRVGELVVNHRPREHGESKYGIGRVPKALLDLLTVSFLTGFGQRPQHLLGKIGATGFFAGGCGLLWLTAMWFISRASDSLEPMHLHQRAVFYYAIAALILGAQFMTVGFLAELILAHHSRDQTNYSVSEKVGARPASELDSIGDDDSGSVAKAGANGSDDLSSPTSSRPSRGSS